MQKLTAAAVLVVALSALADRTVTVLSSRAVIDVAHIHNRYDGGVVIEVCGHSEKSDGGVVASECYQCNGSLPLTGAQLLACYKTGAGL